MDRWIDHRHSSSTANIILLVVDFFLVTATDGDFALLRAAILSLGEARGEESISMADLVLRPYLLSLFVVATTCTAKHEARSQAREKPRVEGVACAPVRYLKLFSPHV
jgi:hypothetical protein